MECHPIAPTQDCGMHRGAAVCGRNVVGIVGRKSALDKGVEDVDVVQGTAGVMS